MDLIVIMDNTSTNFMERRDNFINYYESIPLDVNLSVYTENEIEKMLKNDNLFIKDGVQSSYSATDLKKHHERLLRSLSRFPDDIWQREIFEQ